MEKAERYEAEGASECFVAAAFLQNLMGMPTSLTALSVTRVYVCVGGWGWGGGMRVHTHYKIYKKVCIY